MKKVLLIGDSIRLGYQPFVKELLKDKVEVFGPADNCRFALYTLWHAHQWVGEVQGEIDIIHWNNGIWDIYTHLQDGSSISSVEDYAYAIKRVLKELRQLCPQAKIIFATTSAVNDEHPHLKNRDICQINAAAYQIMKEEGVEINDLYHIIDENKDYISEDMLHLSTYGYQEIARIVAKTIMNSL